MVCYNEIKCIRYSGKTRVISMINISCGASYRIHYDIKDNSFHNNPIICNPQFHIASSYTNIILWIYHQVVKQGGSINSAFWLGLKKFSMSILKVYNKKRKVYSIQTNANVSKAFVCRLQVERKELEIIHEI